MPKHRKPPSQTWKAFLNNHLGNLVSIDFFPVPTVSFECCLYWRCSRDRRRVVYSNVTKQPTALWTGQQIVQAFPEETAPGSLLWDQDKIYGDAFKERVRGMETEEILTARQTVLRTLIIRIFRETGLVWFLNKGGPLNGMFGNHLVPEPQPRLSIHPSCWLRTIKEFGPQYEFDYVNRVPEPATGLLLLAGLITVMRTLKGRN